MGSVVNMSDSVGHVRFFDMIFEVRQLFKKIAVMSDIRAHAHYRNVTMQKNGDGR